MRSKEALSHYDIGITKFDDEHREILALVNQFIECANDHDRASHAAAVMAAIQEHTDAEEAFMREIHFPYLDPHIDEHTRIAVDLTNFLQIGVELSSLILRLKLVSDIETVILSHNDDYDRQYAEFFHRCKHDSSTK